MQRLSAFYMLLLGFLFFPGLTHTHASLVSWYAADGNAKDNIGTRNGALKGNTTFTKGVIDQSFSMDGAGDYVHVANIATLNPKILTLSVWVNPTQLAGSARRGIITKTSKGSWNDGYGLGYEQSTNKVFFFINHWRKNRVSIQINKNRWSHITGVYDGNALKIYLDGVLKATKPYTQAINHNTRPLWIGRGRGRSTYYWNGLIDEVRLYNNALDNFEVQKDYMRLAAWYKAEQNGQDSAGKNNGRLKGNVVIVDGAIDKSFLLDGDGDYINVPHSSELTPKVITVEAWVNSRFFDGAARKGIVTKTATKQWNDGYGLGYQQSNNKVFFFINKWNKNSQRALATIPEGKWVHLLGTYDGQKINLYVNGLLASSVSYNKPIIHNTKPLWIGRGRGRTTYYWEGFIDEVRIYGRAWTAQETWKRYSALKTLYDIQDHP